MLRGSIVFNNILSVLDLGKLLESFISNYCLLEFLKFSEQNLSIHMYNLLYSFN